MNPTILIDNKHPNNPNAIFGKDTKKVLSICESIYNRHMYPFENGKPKNPALYIGNIRPFNDPDGKTWRVCINEWMDNHPVEKAEYDNAMLNWESEGVKLWSTLYGIAKKRHIHIEWLGTGSSCCFPDQFMVRKGGNVVAMIHC